MASMGSQRMSRTGSVRGEGWGGQALNGFSQLTGKEEDEEELRWAAIERLPTYDRVRRGMLEQNGPTSGSSGCRENNTIASTSGKTRQGS
ncbi:hypothetical protein Tsubulata_017949 [Turnera subulata]|uniref:Uncharacterized protein n=1 Tax=Turnera subulata TaxID=218843 RepID=A0A9Q0G8V2_9ROSI|nr:hypothetical protein Tsubulata_017949 [Turnera subulata]